jgi:hypothetical protein
MSFLKYEDVLIQVAGESIFANQASVKVSAPVEPVRLFDGSIHRYAPMEAARGTLSFSHYLTGSIASFLDVTGVSEASVAGTFGGLAFSKAYLTSMDFSVKPYSPILVNNSFDLYGSFTSSVSSSYREDLSKPNQKYSHGIKSFVAGLPSNINHTLSFDYSMQANRNPVFLAGETTPTRVTKENTNINMSIIGNNIGTNINPGGAEANLKCSIYDVNDSTSALQHFYCSGRITNQELNVTQEGYLNGDISVTQAYQ